MPPRRERNDLERFAGPGAAAERRARRRIQNARRMRREARRERNSIPLETPGDLHQQFVNEKHRRFRTRQELFEHMRNHPPPSPTVDMEEEDMFGDPDSTETEDEAGGSIRYGKGWEEEMAKAIARDKEREQDKLVADQLRAAAGADSKSRGGRVRRYANAISRKLH